MVTLLKYINFDSDCAIFLLKPEDILYSGTENDAQTEKIWVVIASVMCISLPTCTHSQTHTQTHIREHLVLLIMTAKQEIIKKENKNIYIIGIEYLYTLLGQKYMDNTHKCL